MMSDQAYGGEILYCAPISVILSLDLLRIESRTLFDGVVQRRVSTSKETTAHCLRKMSKDLALSCENRHGLKA